MHHLIQKTGVQQLRNSFFVCTTMIDKKDYFARNGAPSI